MSIEKPICPNCGSDDVQFDAVAAWNADTQQFELVTEFDHAWCNSCGATSRNMKWVTIGQEEAA